MRVYKGKVAILIFKWGNCAFFFHIRAHISYYYCKVYNIVVSDRQLDRV